MSNKNLLEIDDSIIKNNLLLTEKKKEDEEFLDLLQSVNKAEPPSVTFRPLPGACIKCKTESGEKIFLNICHTTEIPPPKDLDDDEFFKVLGEEQPSWCIPMSIGHERFELDKAGDQCPTYDVALNTKYFEKCQAKKAFWSFTILTIISAVGDKHDKAIESQSYVILKNRKVIGKLHDHRAMKREPRMPQIQKPLIEEIANSSRKSTESTNAAVKSKLEINKKETKTEPEYVILRKPKEGDVEELIAYFKLSSADIRVDVCEDRIIVEAPETNYLIDAFVPYTLDQDKATAVLDDTLNILRVNVPVICV